MLWLVDLECLFLVGNPASYSPSICLFFFCFESEVDNMGASGGGWHAIRILFNHAKSPLQISLYGFSAQWTSSEYCRGLLGSRFFRYTNPIAVRPSSVAFVMNCIVPVTLLVECCCHYITVLCGESIQCLFHGFSSIFSTPQVRLLTAASFTERCDQIRPCIMHPFFARKPLLLRKSLIVAAC